MSGSTSRRLAGVISWAIDGDAWDVVGPLEYQPTDVTVEDMKGQSGVEGYSEMPQVGIISVKLRDRGDETVQSLAAKRNATISATLANGKSVYGAGMWRSGEPPRVNSQDGTFDIEFHGPSVTEYTT